MSHLNSYCAESCFLEGKEGRTARLCREECAVLDPTDGYRVLAGRGEGLTVGEGFAPFEALPAAERCFLADSLGTHSAYLLLGPCRAVLIFAHLLPHTGALLAVSPQGDPAAVRRALALLGRAEFVCASLHASDALTPHVGDEAICRQLTELFYYTDRILLHTGERLPWTHTQLIANFAGCLLDRADLPPQIPPLCESEAAKLTLLLLCIFFTFRSESGRILAEADFRAPTLGYCVSLCAPPEGTDAVRGDYRFLRLPALSDFMLRQTEEGLMLEARLRASAAAVELCAARRADIGLHVLFRVSG